MIEARAFRESRSKLTVALGLTKEGAVFVLDLTKMPNLLIAGATGTGKSVCVNSIIVSLLYKARPDEVKFILIDTKGMELGLYDGIPHMATPVITDAGRASAALKWAVAQTEGRQQELSRWGVRDIAGFNEEVARRNRRGDFDEAGEPWRPLPYIVVAVDEIADLVNSVYEVEEPLTRLAQTARSAGIHLVVATQRPSADVVAGIIKAGFPARISFKVSSKVDSRIAIDGDGAERLLGRGDMLFRAFEVTSACHFRRRDLLDAFASRRERAVKGASHTRPPPGMTTLSCSSLPQTHKTHIQRGYCSRLEFTPPALPLGLSFMQEGKTSRSASGRRSPASPVRGCSLWRAIISTSSRCYKYVWANRTINSSVQRM